MRWDLRRESDTTGVSGALRFRAGILDSKINKKLDNLNEIQTFASPRTLTSRAEMRAEMTCIEVFDALSASISIAPSFVGHARPRDKSLTTDKG